jgi:cold shock CspA family protein
MRYQGRITEWKDDRGFGFIMSNGGGAKVFLHFRSLQKGEPRPAGGELVTYEVVPVAGKGPRAESVAYVDRPRATFLRTAYDAPRRGRNSLSTTIAVVLLIFIAAYTWQKFSVRSNDLQPTTLAGEGAASLPPSSSRSLIEQVAPSSTSVAFKCEGKIHCSQMTSCAEATYYLKNCPGVKIDGDSDGIPCEDQHCGKR